MTIGPYDNIVNVSWGDHTIFGEADGLLNTPEAVRRRVPIWRDELRANTLHLRSGRGNSGQMRAGSGYHSAVRKMKNKSVVDWDEYGVFTEVAHEFDMRAYLYLSLFAEGWPLRSKKERELSFHNEMHGQHFAWQSDFSRAYPEYTVVDRTGKIRQWGVLSLAYPEIRKHLRDRFIENVKGYQFDGLFLCMRTEARPAEFGDQFGFNEAVRADYLSRYGLDILTQDFDVQLWRDLLGEYLTTFLEEIRAPLSEMGMKLSIGCPRGDVWGPPLGNATLEWKKWIASDLVDDLIINQSSSQCPSLHHQLWPMHRGYGYLQNYIDGRNMPPITEQLPEYVTALEANKTRLYVARQWDHRSKIEEDLLLEQPGVSGLVFSSFRHDNPGPLERGNWDIKPN